MRWINTPCTDPAGRVFAAEGNIYRAVFPGQESTVRSIIESGEVRALMDEGLIARTWVSDRKVDGYALVTQVEKAPFDVPCDRYTRAALRSATLRWLEISRRLLPAGLALSDAHFGNFMLFGRNEPRWIDLGGIRPQAWVEDEKPFRSFRKFWGGMLAPLALLTTQSPDARLARLSIADRPSQGPLTPAGEPPLSVDHLVEEDRARRFPGLDGLPAIEAMERLRHFADGLPLADGRGTHTDASAAALLKEVEKLCGPRRVGSVICLGADAFQLLPEGWSGADVLVIDESEGRLDALAHSPGKAKGQLALYYEHPVNRRFVDRAPAADAVLAMDPLAKYAHPSHVAAENLSHVIGALGRTFAVVVTSKERKAETERMLRNAYPSVSAAGSSWFGGAPVVVVGVR